MAGERIPFMVLVDNPFIKEKNRQWTIDPLEPDRSPLPTKSTSEIQVDNSRDKSCTTQSNPQLANNLSAADIEAGTSEVEDHLAYFSQILEKATLSPYPAQSPHLTIDQYRDLYNNNFGSPEGSHFIIHQHDHPIAGTHYDLRLQINETSSVSWAIMYGLPGDPDSVRLNRNATETRIHCLWNHLIETASSHTGSLLIWDTGTYTILPRRSKYAPTIDPDSQRSSSSSSAGESSGNNDGVHRKGPDRDPDRRRCRSLTEQEKLHRAFADRKIRLQLHGTRLPESYVLNLRLIRSEDVAGRQRNARSASGKAPRKRRRRGQPSASAVKNAIMTSSDDDDDDDDDDERPPVKHEDYEGEEEHGHEDVKEPVVQVDLGIELSALEKELRELEDEQVRRTNAYTGAENTIGSVHQRRWYLSLDREACGFEKRYRSRHEGLGKNRRRVEWLRKEDTTQQGGIERETKVRGDFRRLEYPFYVRGVVTETSVITGRRGADILRDEGVVDYVNRQGWKPVLT